MTDIRFDRAHPFRDSKARLEWARLYLPCCMACGRSAGKWYNEWLVMTTHHIIKPGRADEPCNLIRLCWFQCHQLAEGKRVRLDGKWLPVLTLANILWLKRRASPSEWDPERLRELLHENLPEPEEPVEFFKMLGIKELRMMVHITAEDIKEGLPRLPGKCPIALAIEKATKKICSVGATTFNYGGYKDIRLPKKAQDFVRNFDAGKKVKPFSFRIKGKKMMPETEAELFQYWRNLGRTPERLIEQFLSTHNINSPESKTRLGKIIKYAQLLAVEGIKKGDEK